MSSLVAPLDFVDPIENLSAFQTDQFHQDLWHHLLVEMRGREEWDVISAKQFTAYAQDFVSGDEIKSMLWPRRETGVHIPTEFNIAVAYTEYHLRKIAAGQSNSQSCGPATTPCGHSDSSPKRSRGKRARSPDHDQAQSSFSGRLMKTPRLSPDINEESAGPSTLNGVNTESDKDNIRVANIQACLAEGIKASRADGHGGAPPPVVDSIISSARIKSPSPMSASPTKKPVTLVEFLRKKEQRADDMATKASTPI